MTNPYHGIKETHELAKLLLSLPNLPIATHARGCTNLCDDTTLFQSNIKIGTMVRPENRQYLVIGDLPNGHFKEIKNGKIYPYT